MAVVTVAEAFYVFLTGSGIALRRCRCFQIAMPMSDFCISFNALNSHHRLFMELVIGGTCDIGNALEDDGRWIPLMWKERSLPMSEQAYDFA